MLKRERVIFPSHGGQRVFLELIGQKLAVASIARICNCSERTVRDWRREKFSIPLSSVRTLSARTLIPIPKDILIRDAYAHTKRAGRMGAAVTIEKYGRIPHDEKLRKERWRLWWESTGKFKKNQILEPRPIHKPGRSLELAEFIGIIMGDGSISEYQVVITLHHIDDLEYAAFVVRLIKKLFKVTPRVYHSQKNSVNDIVVSRKELVHFLHTLGLPIGNKVKQQFDIPEWIKRDRKLATACVRGLVDTDGCIFLHRYRVKGRWYAYKKLSFTSASEPLRQSVYDLLKKFDFHPRLNGKDVRLNRIEDMRRYFSLVSTHNPKHLRRYENAVG